MLDSNASEPNGASVPVTIRKGCFSVPDQSVFYYFLLWVSCAIFAIAYGNTGFVSIDSPYYIANWWSEWFHPHHLLWTPLLGFFHGLIGSGLFFDRFQSAMILNVFAGSTSVLLLLSILRTKVGCQKDVALAIALAFALSPLHLAMSVQAEAYSATLCLVLGAWGLRVGG